MVEPTPTPSPALPAATPALPGAQPRPARDGLRLLLPLGLIVGLLLLVIGLAGGGARWLLATDAGTLWLLQRLPMVQVKNFQGALLGDRWRADSLRVEWDGGRQWLLLEGLAADGLRWSWRPNPQAWVGIAAQRLAVTKLTLHTGPASTTNEPLVLPTVIAPPLLLGLDEVHVEVAQIDQLEPLTALQLRNLLLDPRPGATHKAEQFSARGYGVQVEGGFSLGNAAPLPLQAQVELQPAVAGDDTRWNATLQAGGTLAQIELSGKLRGQAGANRPAPLVDLRAGIRPTQAWPLTALDLRTQALDLAALTPQAPSTRISGEARLQGGSQGAPLQATVNLTNAQPGRWNEKRLPLQKLTLDVQGRLDQPDRVEFSRFELLLADAMRGAGRWSGSAVWQGQELSVDTQLAHITPQRLDSRAAAMTLSGPVAVTLRGLPSPDFNAAPANTPAAAPHVAWKIDLQGKLDAAPQPVQVKLEGTADDDHVELALARAQAGAASLDLKARLARAGTRSGAVEHRHWQLTTTGTLDNFDPLPWWPGDADPAWRKGPHRVSGDWQFDVRLPANAERLKPVQVTQRLAGNGKLRIHDSQLAGVPLAADATLGYAPGSGAMPGSLVGELTLGGNKLVFDARGDPAGDGGSDRWRAELKADALAALAPLLRLSPALAEWAPRQGSVNATLSADGRWPTLRSEGTAQVAQLQAGKLGLQRADASWRIDTSGPRAPLSVQLDLAGLSHDQQRADRLRGALSGTLAEHQITVSGALPLAPPPAAGQLFGVNAQAGTQAHLQAQGGWTTDPAGGGRWRARVERLLVGSWDGKAEPGSTPTLPAGTSWIDARDLRAELQVDGNGALQQLQADAGRMNMAGAIALRWDAIQLDLRGAQPLINLRANIEPFEIAPLLARAQPRMGWAGDLKLGARLDIRAAERMDADVVIERSDGDLHMNTADGTQLFGLTQLRVAISAHDGVWNFNPVFRGRSLGDITGQLRVQTAPERRWPDAAAPVSGEIQAQVADIGIWNAWVPPGWRMTGELRTTAAVSGSFGAPRYTGQIAGSKLGVRNLLQGVNVSDGQVLLRLEGDNARLERFTLKGGDGSITITGGATLGNKPQARLQLQADRFRVLGRVDRNIIASGNAELQLQADSARLDGKLTIDEGLIDASRSDAPSLDDDVSIRQAGQDFEDRAAPDAPKSRFNFVMGVDLNLGEQMRIRGYGVDTLLHGQLRLTTPGGRLAVNGTINTEGGSFAAYGQKLTIERGIAAFSGPLDNPRLDILALRPNIDARVGAQITGNLLTYRLRLYSEPEMSDNQKLSWLVLGRESDGLGRNDAALLQRAAVALFGGGEGEAPTDQLMKALGIDDISLGERSGTGDTRETVVSIGKQLSRRWYLGYERGVNSTTGTWQLIYRIAQRLTVRMQSGLENALDVIWTWRVQETSEEAAMRKSVVVPP